MRMARFALLLSLLMLFAGVGRSRAQTTLGTLVGTVRDQQGGVVPEARITVTNRATGLVRTTTTAANGLYRVPALPPGSYDILVERQGFANAEAQSVEVIVNQTETVDIQLKVAAAPGEKVTVVGGASPLKEESATIGAVIDNKQVVDLPLNGRNFAQLARLVPGVAASGGGGGQQGGEGGVTGYSSNGQRSTSNNFLIDGVDNNNYFSGSVAQLPSIDSVEAFEVQTNTFAAEYGRSSGSVLNLVTKSGTNDFHGSVFEFLRNDVLDARNFFDPPQFDKPALHLNQFGATFGGPIVRNKTFFFLSYEGFRQRAGLTTLANVPTLDQRNGIFDDGSGGTVTVPVHPVSAALFDLYPDPNVSLPSGNFASSPTLINDTDQGLVKVDHQFGNSDTLSGRFSRSRVDSFFPITPGQSGTSIPGYGLIGEGGSNVFSVNYTHVVNPRMLNEARIGFIRTRLLNVTESGPKAADFGFNNGQPPDDPLNRGNIPQLTFSGGFVSGSTSVSNLGGSINFPSQAVLNTLQFVDNFSIVTARHAFKLGGDIRRLQMNRFFDLAFSGQIIFDGSQNPEGISNPLVDFAEGRPSGSLLFVGDSNRGFRTTSFNFFAQDTFKIRSNLTLSYGLRYELNTVLNEVQGRASTFRADRFETFLPPDVDQTDVDTLRRSGVVLQDDIPGLYDGNHHDFAPRVGIAYSLGSGGKTVIRASYGIFYDTIIGNIPGNIMLNPPDLPAYFTPAPFVGFPASFAPAGFPVLTVTTEDFSTPYAQHYNLNVQRQLPGQMLLEVAYVGTTGRNLPRFRQINQAFITQAEIDQLSPDVVTRMVLIGIPLPVAQFLSTHPELMPPIVRNTYFGFAQIFTAETTQNSNYNSLQAKIEKRTSHGLSFLMAYTYSKSIDDSSVFFGSGANGTTIFPQDNFNLAAERGRSDFDIRHRLSWSFIYELPVKSTRGGFVSAVANGWRIGGILTLQSGQPFSVLTGSDNSRTGLGNDRPDVIADPNNGPGTVDEWFNTSAFVPNALLTFGSAGRNIVNGPDFKNFDFSIMKDTRVTERVGVQFRAEFFNLTNHPNFALPSNVLSAPNFGSLFRTPDVAQNNVGLGSGGPRLIQFGFKLSY